MKKIILSITIVISAFTTQAQIYVDKVDITKTVNRFDVWAFTKPFTTKSCYFMDFGQDGFKPVNYDLTGQAICDSTGEKFKKGEWIKLVNYLESQGYEEAGNRQEKIGNITGTVTTFKRKKE